MIEPSAHYSATSEYYTSRASSYDDSWHPDLAKLFVSEKVYTPPPGSAILDLCTGTFLLGAEYASAVGATGKVLGVDISKGMLEIARERINDELKISDRCSIVYRNVVELDKPLTEEAKTQSEVNVKIDKAKWDVISCCSAFVLLPKTPPSAILSYWKEYLRPETGKMVIDFPVERTQFLSDAFARIARLHGFRSPLDRDWITGQHAIRKEFTDAGLHVEKIVRSDLFSREEYNGSQGEIDRLFPSSWKNPLLRACYPEDMNEEAAKREFTSVWKEMFEELQQDGVMASNIQVYVVVASRP